MNSDLAVTVRGHGVLAGSILGLDQARALDEAEQLRTSGDWIHIDIIDASYPRGHGVDEATIALLPETWWRAIDVHLMVSEPPERLPALARAGRVTVHLREPGDTRVLNTVLAIRSASWISIEPQLWSAAALIDLIGAHQIAGVLMMLTTPARSGASADPAHMEGAAWETLRGRLPLGVDGGVTRELIAALAGRGASYFVVGRALFEQRSG